MHARKDRLCSDCNAVNPSGNVDPGAWVTVGQMWQKGFGGVKGFASCQTLTSAQAIFILGAGRWPGFPEISEAHIGEDARAHADRCFSYPYGLPCGFVERFRGTART